MPYLSEENEMEQNLEDEIQESYMEELVEARIENAIVRYEYTPIMVDVETEEESSYTKRTRLRM